jgi:amino acid adenylation domain-containing protein/FkbM family methyltransferase
VVFCPRTRKEAGGEERMKPKPTTSIDTELSYGQRALWFLDRLAPGNAAYIIAGAARVVGPFDPAALRRAVVALASRHPALRSTFRDTEDGPVQRMCAEGLPGNVEIVEEDGAALSAPERVKRLSEIAFQPFDLATGPLLRVGLLRFPGSQPSEAGYLLSLSVHHIVSDFWSLAVILRDLGALYAAELGGTEPALLLAPPPEIGIAEIVHRERESLAGERGEEIFASWRQALDGFPVVLELPTDRQRPAAQGFRGASLPLRLDPTVADAVRRRTRKRGATLYMGLLAAFDAVLARHSHQEKLLVGCPTTGRGDASLAGLVGYLVNPVPIPGDLSGDPDFGELLARVRAAALGAFGRQAYPFPLLAERLQPERDSSRSPLFQVLLVLQKGRRAEEEGLAALSVGESGVPLELGGGALRLESLALDEPGAQLDLQVMLAETAHGIAGRWLYDRDLFEPATMERMAGHFANLLGFLAADTADAFATPLSELPLLGPAERAQLTAWADGGLLEPGASCLHERVFAQAARTPEDIALWAGERRLTYSELAAGARRIAGHLRALGVGPEMRVGLCSERTPEMILGLLGILAAGGAYVPLDPAYPAERLALMLEDSGAALVLVSGGAAGRLPAGTRTVFLEQALEEALAGGEPDEGTRRHPEPANLAYLIYTSGSTGRPKAVAIAHGSASALVTWAAAAFSPAELSGVLAATSIAFDLSVFEIFVPLSLGGTVILAENALGLPQLPARGAVTLVNTVPSAMAELVRSGALPPSVRTVNLAGEPLPGSLARQIHAIGVGRLLNLYGPSEDTTYSTQAAVLPAGSGEPGEPGEPVIGRPLPGGRAYVVDPRQQPAPLGVPGELWLGGAGLARGYLGRPELTAARFVPDPWSGVPGARLYRTGDLVRFLLAGDLMFLGRLDHQVKVRGFRIELGEVESALAALPGVRAAVVLARDEAPIGSGKRLVAYVSGDGIDPEGLRAGLAASLPGYMVPPAFVLLPALPLTPNGKADRRALAGIAPGTAAGPGHGGYVAPRTATETLLAAIWVEVLRAERVGVTDDFFQLGGHSLLATQVASRVRRALGVEIAVRRLFEARTVATLALEIEGLQTAAASDASDASNASNAADARFAAAASSREPASRDPRLDGWFEAPPSFAQERLWFLDRLEPGTAAYNVPVALRLGGRLEVAALAAALASVVSRHEALRTTFTETSGRPLQVIGPARAAGWSLPVVDLAALPEIRREDAALALAREEAALPFDLGRGPLLRAALVRLSPKAATGPREGDHLLLLTLHHIVTDGWSMGVLVREVGEVYGALWTGRPAVLPELPLQYRDYAAWQRDWLAGEVLRGQLAWWRERLSGMPPLLELPTDRPRPAVQGTAGGSLAVALPEGLTASLYQLAEGGISDISGTASLFMVLLAGFQALLARHAGQSRVVVGSPVANRNHRRIEDLIGLFANTLALPGDLSGDPPFAGLLARARETALGAYSHQELPFEKLVEELSPGRSLAHTPLFQVLLVLQNADMGPPALPGLTSTLLDIPSGMEKFDLTLDLQERAGGLAGKLTYRLDLFDPPTVERLFSHFVNLLAGAVADPAVRLADLPLLSAAERAQLAEWSGTASMEEPKSTLQNPLAASCARVPERVALVTATSHLSYGELASGTRRIASRLHALGAGPEVRIGLASARSEEMVLGLLGILAAGAAYVPLDPAYPAERLALLLADSGADLVLAGRSVLERVPAGARVVLLEDLLASPHVQAGLESSLPVAQPGNLAYLIYTSGSTGRPKAVAIAHASAFALVRWAAEAFSPEELSGVLAATSIAFDLSVFELFVPLVLGGTVLLADNALALPGLPARDAVTLVNTVPSAMAELLRDGALPAAVRTVNLAGEPLVSSLARQVAAAGVGRLLNLYGPSEDTTYSTWEAVAAFGPREPGIGRPISGGRAYVVDPGLQLAPPGVPGELWLGGAGLARGYLGRPEGTAERFVPDPWSGLPGERLYRTGDLVRFRPEGEPTGELMFLGRLDHQVKVRGFRIELGEVEAALAGLPGVREAVVLARDENTVGIAGTAGKRLVAYVSGDRIGAEGLREQLAASLPEHMVPSVFVLLPALPLTPNGKVDRRMLAGIAAEPGAGTGVSYTPPRTPTEALLAAIWMEVLGVDRVGMEDDFFLLGGHSLLATQVVSRLRRTLGVEVSVRRLFEARTVAALAREVEMAPAAAAPAASASSASAASAAIPPLLPVPRLPEGTELPLSFAQERLWFLDQLEPGSAAYNMAAGLSLTGRLDLPALSASLGEVVRRHEALRTTFRAGAEGAVQLVGGTAGELPLPRRLPVVDLRGLPAGRRESAARKLLAAAALQPFDLARGPLLRARLFRLTADEHVFFLCLHHIVADGWSIGLLVREVAALYPAFLAGLPSPLPELPIQYGDFSVWQRRWLSGETLARRVAWWREHLQGIPPLELPTDRLRPADGFHGGGEMREVALPTALLGSLRALAAERRGTLFMVLLAGFEALLGRYSGQTDLAVGSVVANRGRVEVEELIGFFVNTLALRARLDGDPAYSEILDRVRETTLAAYAREDVPFELLVEALAPRRDLARTPLFDAVLNVQPAGLTAPLSLPGLDLRPVTLPPGPAKFDLTLNLFESAEGLVGNLAYRPELFDAATIERLAGHFATLLAGAAADPGCRLSRLPLLTAAERQALLEGNATAVRYPGSGTLSERFAAQAEESPDAVALVFDRAALTYRRLAAESRSLARRLRWLGVGPEVPVGICLERSFDLVIGLSAILEAGGAYVPLDPSYPRERLAGMLADAGAPVVLTWRRLEEVLPAHAGRTVFLDEPIGDIGDIGEALDAAPAPVQAGLDNLAYVIFTSGSTGRPKGAMNSHRGIVNRLLWMQETYGLTPADRVLQKTPFSFDVSVWEFFWPLLTGACLVVARPGEHQAPARLARTILEESVTTLHFVPAMLQAFLEEPSAARCRSVRRVMASGEALPLALQNRFFERLPDAALHNLYGPTEAAVDVTFWACERDSARTAVPIGRPVANTALHLLDAGFEPVPIGVPGELVLGGVQVGRGYFGRPELTAERFVPDPAGETGGRAYRTGDLVRRLPGGEVEFLGRIDHQVKIRGLRIELGEIESALARHPAVQEAVVLAEASPSGDGPTGDAADRRLVAYVVPEARRAAPLRARLRLEREGRLTASDLHELPNGMAVAHRNRGETEFLYREIFVDEGYLRHGIAVADGDTIFDVGANIGLFALFAGRRARGVRIFAFEPIPEVFAALRLNAALHGLDARLFDCGVAEAAGRAEFTYYPHATLISGRFADGAQEREVVRSFVESQAQEDDGAAELGADRLEEMLTERLEARQVICELRTLSEVIAAEGVARIDLLKIDVEKSELAVLAGLAEEDWGKVRQVVLEVHDVEGRLAEVLALLERHGFEVAAEQDLELSGTALYNLYARRPTVAGESRVATPPEPAWESAGALVADVTAALRTELPEFMVPAAFTVLEAFPLSPSGKVDRRALAGSSSAAAAAPGARKAPSRPMERLLAGLWAELLRRDPEEIGAEDNFFVLGGHSLLGARLLSRLESRLEVEIPLRRLFTSPILADLAREVEAAVAAKGKAAGLLPLDVSGAPGAPLARPAELPLSFSQERLWFLDQLEPGSAVYNVPALIGLRGELSLGAIAAALDGIVRRHEVLRTTFARAAGASDRPIQVIAAERRVEIPIVDLGALPAPLRRATAESLTRAEAGRPFDLGAGPLLRALLVRLTTPAPDVRGEHLALLNLHHIVADGWSTGVLIGELAALYTACLTRQTSPLPALPWQYADYALWQRQLLAGPELERQLGWWREHLAGAPEALELPTDRPRPAVQSFRGARLPFVLPAGLTAAARRLSEESGASLFMTLLAVFQALLARLSGQDDLTVGSPIAGRRRPEVYGLIGFFVNTLVLRLQLTDRADLRGLLARTRESTLGAFENQDVPFERLVEALRPARQLARTPLFQVMFVLQNAPSTNLVLPGLDLAALPVEIGVARFDLTFVLREGEGGLAGGIEYNRDLFDVPTVARLAAHFETLLEAAVAAPDRAVTELPLLSPAERHQALREWNDRAEEYPKEGLVPSLLAAVAAARPDAPALGLGLGGERMSYRELELRATRIARHLVAAGVGPDDLVGIAIERSFAMVAALLGIWKAGAAYLPLDVHLPPERLAFLLADGAVEIVLTQESLEAALPAAPEFRGRTLRVEDLWAGEPAGVRADLSDFPELPDRAAYVIYTSGSTGRPKGVVISHRALGNRLRFAQTVELSPGDSFVQKTTTSFDASVCEIFSPLLTGGTVVLARPGGEREPAYLVDLVRDWRIPHMSFTMAMLGTLLDEQSLAGCDSLRTVLVGGEAMPPDLPARFHAQSSAEIFNRYGPTETTISITSWRSERGCQGRTVPIGRPIARTEIHVLDHALQPVPVGVAGELAIGGVGLARGYLARPDVTAERFVPHPFCGEPGARLYLSGDLVRFRPDGALEFLGRTDNQVKIRGFRVELGEIETALEEHPAVAQVAVVDLPDPGTSSKRLVAYFVPHPEGDLAPRELQEYLATKVPGYMVPAVFVRLDAMPLTPTGKTDRQALPEPAAERPAAAWEAPRTPIEEVLAGIWEELLGVRQVDRRDSFFELGGHSLLATRLVSRLREAAAVELPLKAVFEAPTLAGLAELVEAGWRDGGAPSAPPIRPVPRRRDLPLSFSQERLWFLEQLEPGNASYHLPVAVRFKGRLEAAALAGALAAIVARHEALRTRFVTVEGRPAQAISARVSLGLPSVDLSLLTADREEEVRRLALEAARQPFDLERGPLLRTRLLRLGEEENVLLLSMHHIVSDGWSMGVLVRELGALYRAAVEGRPSPLPALPIQYPDFAVWQREWLSGEVLAAELAWWRERLAGAPAVLKLPTDRPRPAVARFRGAGLPFHLPAAVTAGLEALCRRRGVTPFMALLGGFSALLWRWAGQDDLVVGTPIAGRTQREIEGLIGFFVNTLALRTDLSGEPGFAELLARVREGALAAYAHPDVPFDKLVEVLAPERSLAHAPLFQVFLVLQNTPAETLRLPGLDLEPVELGTGAAKFDLTLALGSTPDGLSGVWEYDRDLFDPATIARLGGQLGRLLEAAVAAPEARIGALSLLSAAERQQLVEWNGTAAAYREVSLAGLLAEQAARTPDAAAVVFEDEVLSYGGLAARAGRLAGELRLMGVGPEVRVGICAERSLGLLVGLVAILEAGGAYVPLDPSYPADRLAFMLEDSGVPVLLTEGSLAGNLPVDGLRVLHLDRPLPASAPYVSEPAKIDPDQLAYVIYTSGSTGRPKGAMNAHRGIVNRLLWMRERYAVGPGDRVLQKTPVSFDVSVWELFVPLVTGACLVVARPGGHQDPAYLVETIARQAITLLHFVPAMLSAFLEAPGVESCTAVRQVIASGEALPSDLERRFFSRLTRPEARLDNLYGPTEAAVEVTFWSCDREGTAGRVPIGRPVANTAIHLLGRDLRPVPPGGLGELAIAGVQVGRGYLGRPELTAERFLPDPFADRPGARLYLTGDLARHLPDGPIEYLGRIDHQVKLRGFRIELGEIESALLGHPGVRDAAALVRPMRDGAPGDLLLVAYVVPERIGEDLEGSLRSFLGERLPAHMLPAVFVLLPHLPLTPNGKVDRRALPAPDWRAGSSYVAPRTPLEEVLASFFAEILGLEQVGVEDGFFKLGGHSLLAAQLVAKVRGAFQVELPLRRLFETPTVSAVAAAVAAAEGKPGQNDKIARILLRVHRMAAEKRLAEVGDTGGIGDMDENAVTAGRPS